MEEPRMSLNDLLTQIIKMRGDLIKNELEKKSPLEQAGFRLFTPLIINFVAQPESASITVMRDASLRLSKASSHPDIMITSDCETLNSLLLSGSSDEFMQAEKEEKIRFAAHSLKGQRAIAYVKEMFSA